MEFTNKLIEKSHIAKICSEIRSTKEKIVLCHGVFDILHIGHKRHLHAAKNEGDILIVSLTMDRHVNKGPGRPIFSEKLRAEMVASLACVDFVVLNDESDAITMIREVKPNVYFKGDEYKFENSDVSGMIMKERSAVEELGGEIRYSSELTFSSSNIAKKTFSKLSEEVQEYLVDTEQKFKIDQLHDITKRLKNRKVLVIGEVIIDEYTYVSGLGKPSKENIISTLYDHSEQFMGGVLPIVNTIAEFSNDVELLTLVGSGEIKSGMVQDHVNSKVNSFAFSMPNSVTVRKQRMIDKDFFRKIFEVNHVTKIDDNDENYGEIEEWLGINLGKYDIVLVADFGHGLVRKKTAKLISDQAKFLCINVQTNSYNRGFNLITKYDSANFACIDGPEARLALADNVNSIENISSQILKKLRLEGVVITNGKLGAIALDRSGETSFVPAFSINPVDTMGAGDAFFSLASIYFFESQSLAMACFMGNAHASMQVETVGHRDVVDSTSMLKFVKSLMS